MAIYVDGQPVLTTTADVSRADVGSHGFDVLIPVPAGPDAHHTIYAVSGHNWFAYKDYYLSSNPYGFLDGATQSGTATTSIQTYGWAIDPDSASAIDVQFYLDGVFAGATSATVSRADVGAVYPGYGDAHGFSTQIPAGVGTHTLCAYGINVGPGANAQLVQCRPVTMSPLAITDFHVNPDAIYQGHCHQDIPINVMWWTTGANEVRVYRDGQLFWRTNQTTSAIVDHIGVATNYTMTAYGSGGNTVTAAASVGGPCQ